MEKIKIWVESHPYLTGGVILGAIVLYLLYKNSQSAATSTASTSTGTPYDSALQQAELAAGTQLQGYQIQANAQTESNNAALMSQQLTTAAATQQSYYANQNQLQATLSAAQNTSEQTSAQLQLGLAQTLAGGGVSGSQETQTIYGVTQLNAGTAATQAAQQAAINSATTNPVLVSTTPMIPSQSYSPAGTTSNIPSDQSGYIPSAYQSYIAGLVTALPVGDVNTADVEAHYSAVNQANAQYVSDPNSPHNVDVTAPAMTLAEQWSMGQNLPPQVSIGTEHMG